MLTRINVDLKKAMQKKDKDMLKVLRALKSAVQYKKIEQKKDLSDEEIISVFKVQVKQRQQAAELYIQGERPELAEIEKKEIEIIKAYLPEEISEAELEKEVSNALVHLNAESMKDMGIMMKYLKEKLGSNVDGKSLSAIVRRELQS
ncbi:MAG: GatB/YqeY domain-containing protein [Candidatus Cloacimonadota bacterium]|nr:MAG: GatB/YqeY domain-containing protein [Candidatus Cloacimonadota bacterium]HHE64392.1 GatB/YqeY domain-containing protein [Bacteroidota bacterium]